jgi:hypothetical protein
MAPWSKITLLPMHPRQELRRPFAPLGGGLQDRVSESGIEEFDQTAESVLSTWRPRR